MQVGFSGGDFFAVIFLLGGERLHKVGNFILVMRTTFIIV